ncbi:MAG TPA: type IV toxin-antitoxin system AbiEi family antitoxin [Pseudolysinimonas sp.]|nr:type IV toxin-antitoxin system AbiEi family antitoxin [Pseudolysinimonas sp.]
MDESELIELVAAAIRNLGFSVAFTWTPGEMGDGEITIGRRGSVETRAFEVKRHLTLSKIDERPGIDPSRTLFMSEYINEKTAAALRRRGVQYADSMGNAYLESDSWIVDVRGRKTPAQGRARSAGYATETLYSPKRAQVIFALLNWPHLMTAPLREVSSVAGVSLGLTQTTISALRNESGLWPDSDTRRQRLIDGWAASFGGLLGPSLRIREFRAEQTERTFGDGYSLSGESAPSLAIRPARIVMYVNDLVPELIMMNRWRADGEPNVFVRRRFWTVPEAATESERPGEAPALIVYADLLSSDDPRVQEAAREYRAGL